MPPRPPLSQTKTGQAWLKQFCETDRCAAAAMLDGMLLLNEEQVATALRSLLREMASAYRKEKKRVGLYAEREFGHGLPFDVEPRPDKQGVIRQRAVGFKGPHAVSPVRGSRRVGSEGPVAHIISQVVKTSPHVFVNQPGPDRIRGFEEGAKGGGKSAPIRVLMFVTDFIGSGSRVRKMLNKFWAVPSVRSWASLGLMEFSVVAAAGTLKGIESLRTHRLEPEVRVEHVAPTLSENSASELFERWRQLIRRYGPSKSAAGGREGFRGSAALMAFSYGIPNNAPLFLHKSGDRWKALYVGPAPEDLRLSFGLETTQDRIARVSAISGVTLAPDVAELDAMTVLVLSFLRGRWSPGEVTALAEQTGLTEREVLVVKQQALATSLIDATGHLTDAGQELLGAALRKGRKRPTIPTATEVYYPQQLRTPRVRSSVRRSSERPR